MRDDDLIRRGDALAEVELYRKDWVDARDAIAALPAVTMADQAERFVLGAKGRHEERVARWKDDPHVSAMMQQPAPDAQAIMDAVKRLQKLYRWLDTDAEVLADMDARDLSDHQHIQAEVSAILAMIGTTAQPAGDAQAIRDAAQVLLDAMTARPAKCDPFDPCDQEVERLAIQYSGQGGDAVAVLETAEKFMLAGLRALIGTTAEGGLE